MKTKNNLTKTDKKMINSIFLRSFTIFSGLAGGQVRCAAEGFIYCLEPVFKRFYQDKPEKRKAALKRHTMFYNITSNVGTFCMGLVASMEKDNALSDNFDEHSIVAIKTSLMGPMSGVGDAIFWGVLRVIAAAIGINLALEGSIMGAILFLLVYNIPSVLCRYYLTYAGYTMGESFLSKIEEMGAMKILTKAASILGLIMIVAMTASTVKFSSILEFSVPNSDPVLLQTYLDTIFKGLVPLTFTMGCLYLMKKRVNVNLIMFIVMGLTILLAVMGIV